MDVDIRLPRKLTIDIFIAFRRCPRLGYLFWNLADESINTQSGRFFSDNYTRTRLVRLAQLLFPNSIDVKEESTCFEEWLDKTRFYIRRRQPLLNAVFDSSLGIAVADILLPVDEDHWEMLCVGVGSAGNIQDVMAFQAAVLLRAGIELKRCALLKINSQFTRKPELEPKQLFKKQNYTRRAAVLQDQVEEIVSDFFRTIRRAVAPEVLMDKPCFEPELCPFYHNCYSFLPEQNVLELYRGFKKGLKLLREGIVSLKDIQDSSILTKSQKIQVDCAKSGLPHINKRALKSFLNELEYPLYFLDFETISPPFPVFEGTRPFELVPFQFSLNIVKSREDSAVHMGYLADGERDPRPEILRLLQQNIGDTGKIVAYNAKFEKICLDSLANARPEYKEWVESIKARMVDLLQPFRGFYYYHPGQRGSASLKDVLPWLTGKNYKHLVIQNGEQASREFIRIMTAAVSFEEKALVRRQLEEYCYTDSIGMLWIVRALEELVS